MNVRYIGLLLYFLLFVSVTHPGVGSTRGLVIVSEYGENETLAATLDQDPSMPLSLGQGKPAGLGAASKLLLTALYQEVPVLAPAPLWDTIVEHKKLFDRTTQANVQSLYQCYGNSRRFGKEGELEEFRERSVYIKHRYDKIKQELSLNSRDKLEQLIQQDALFSFESAPDSVKTMDALAWNEVSSYLMCSVVPIERFIVREILVPQAPELPFYLFIPKTLFFSMYDRERSLGLTVDHWPSAPAIFAPKVYPHGSSVTYPQLLEEVLKALFIPKAELANTSLVPQRWSIFLMGHGSYCDQDQRAAKIAGLSLEEFKKVLLFLDNAIDTRLFFYVSCSAGGKNFIDAFTHDGQPMQLSYPVFAYALTEGASFVTSPSIRLDFFSDKNAEDYLTKLIDWDKKHIVPDAPYNFAKFFALSQETGCAKQTINHLIRSLNPSHRLDDGSLTTLCRLSDHEVNNATSVRLPRTSMFRVINDIESFVPLYGTSTSPCTVAENKELLLLCDSTLPYTIKLEHGGLSLPSVVSLIPGRAAHAISKLEAPHALFSSVIKNFFACQKLLVPKLFHLKRLTCLQDESSGAILELSDVLLFNYVPSRLVTSSYLQSIPSSEFCNGIIVRKGGQTCMFLWNVSDPAPTITVHQLTPVPGGLFGEAVRSFFNATPSWRQDPSCSALITPEELCSYLKSYYNED